MRVQNNAPKMRHSTSADSQAIPLHAGKTQNMFCFTKETVKLPQHQKSYNQKSYTEKSVAV